MAVLNSYRDLIVWQRAIELVIAVYRLTEGFPKEEVYGITSQMRRCAVSIPSNIAEGRMRGTRKDFRQFIMIAYGSGAELETQVTIAKRLSYGQPEHYNQVETMLTEVMKMLNSIAFKLKATS